jgi:hypothetical protein
MSSRSMTKRSLLSLCSEVEEPEFSTFLYATALPTHPFQEKHNG